MTTTTSNDITDSASPPINYASETSTTSSSIQVSTLTTTNVTATLEQGGEEIFKTVTFAGSIAAIVIYFCVVGLLFGSGFRGIRAHIHCNVSFSLMTSHILLLIGADRVGNSLECKLVSMATQFSVLVGLTWLMLEGIHLFHLSMVGSDIAAKGKKRKRLKPTVERAAEDSFPTSGSETANREQNTRLLRQEQGPQNSSERANAHNGRTKTRSGDGGCCMPRLALYYIIGWFGPAMFIGATVPAALDGYGRSENCWLATDIEIVWVFGAPVPAIFIFHCLATLLSIANYKQRIRKLRNENDAKKVSGNDRDQEVEGSNSSSTPPLNRRRSEAWANNEMNSEPNGQEPLKNQSRNNVDNVESGSDESCDTFSYTKMRNHSLDERTGNAGYLRDVLVHPPIHEITQRRLAVSLPDDESDEAPKNYLNAVYWNLALMPLVSITWCSGIIAVNFHLMSLLCTFCALNVLQSIYIFVFYCIATFRLRRRWFAMTSEEVNDDVRPITVLLGTERADACDAINDRRMGRRRNRRKKIPNIELLMRTPTPFPTTSHGDSAIEKARRSDSSDELQSVSDTQSNERDEISSVTYENTLKTLGEKSPWIQPIRLDKNGDNCGLYGENNFSLDYDVDEELGQRINTTLTTKNRLECSSSLEEFLKLSKAGYSKKLSNSTQSIEKRKTNPPTTIQRTVKVEAVAVLNVDATFIFQGVESAQDNFQDESAGRNLTHIVPISKAKSTPSCLVAAGALAKKQLTLPASYTDPHIREGAAQNCDNLEKSNFVLLKTKSLEHAGVFKRSVRNSKALESPENHNSPTNSHDLGVNLSSIISSRPFNTSCPPFEGENRNISSLCIEESVGGKESATFHPMHVEELQKLTNLSGQHDLSRTYVLDSDVPNKYEVSLPQLPKARTDCHKFATVPHVDITRRKPTSKSQKAYE